MPTGGAGRTRRPATTPLVGMKSRVPERTRLRANAAADALGITLGQYVELLVERDEFDSAGRPVWAGEVFPPRHDPIPGLERTDAA